MADNLRPTYYIRHHSNQIQKLKTGKHIELRYRWNYRPDWWNIFIAAFLNVFWLGFLFVAATPLAWAEKIPAMLTMWVGFPFGPAALVGLYLVLGLSYNTTRMYVEDGQLIWYTKPFPLRRRRKLPIKHITRLQLEPSRHPPRSTLFEETPTSQDLFIVTQTGKKRQLLINLSDDLDRRFIKKEMELILGLDHDEDVERKAKL